MKKDNAMRCPQCGETLLAGEKFCISCGAPVSPQQPAHAVLPVGQLETEKAAGFWRSPAGITLIAVLCLLVAAGAAVGLFFAFKGSGDDQAKVDADKVIEDASEELNALIEDLEDLDAEFDDITFKAPDGGEEETGDIEDSLNEASGSQGDIVSELDGLESEELTQGQEDRLSVLSDAVSEVGKAIDEMKELLKRAQSIREFEVNIEGAVSDFEAAIITQNQASQQYRDAQYAAARNTAQTALEQLGKAQACLRSASETEPGADLSSRITNVANAEKAIVTFQQMCDAAEEGDIALQNALSDQFNAETSAVSNDIRFEYDDYFAGEIDGALTSIADHLGQAAESLEESARE